jgi:phosphomethylpyrimidine synthase
MQEETLKVKVNVGCSNISDDVEIEKHKIRYAVDRGVDYISEISLIPAKKSELHDFIQTLDRKTSKFCTVPLYDSVLTRTSIISLMRDHFEHGIRCFTLHLTPKFMMKQAIKNQFIINSRAGNFLASLARMNSENPHFADFQEIMTFIRDNNCELFVGTSLRPGRVAESQTSTLWQEELKFIIEFMMEQGVLKSEFILECGGHLDATVLSTFVDIVKDHQICVMGPLMTDATNAFDDISSVLGATVLSRMKPIHTHLLLTKDEHIRLPTLDALKSGVDTVLVLKHNLNLLEGHQATVDKEFKFRNQSNQCSIGVNLFGPLEGDLKVCSMCGFHCPLRNIKYPSISLYDTAADRRRVATQ